ncbi:MAG: hypothetical protein WBA57_24235 [Elainellaceae cyanobacterium]
MANSTLIQRAKSGDPEAIAHLINRQLNAKGISAQVSVDWDGLTIALQGQSQAPAQQSAIAYLRKAFERLQSPSIQIIHIQGMRQGESKAAWADMIVLERSPQFDSDPSEAPPTPQPSASPDDADPEYSESSDFATPSSQEVPAENEPYGNVAPTSSATLASEYSDDFEADSDDEPSSRFNGTLFRLGWLALNVPLVWLFHLMPRILASRGWDFALTSPLRPLDTYLWVIMVPISLGQWLLLRRHLSKAYWWAIALLILFYFEELMGVKVLSIFALQRFGINELLGWLLNIIRGFIFGLVVGIPQWIVLRRSLGHAVRTANWIWISAIAWMFGLGLPTLFIVMWMPNFLDLSGSLYPLFRVAVTLAKGMDSLLYALITGIVLARWIRIAKATPKTP